MKTGVDPEVTHPRFPTFLEVGHSDIRHGSPTARSEHFTDYLKARLSEPCNRGILKSTHHVRGFLEQITGAPTTGRLTALPRLSSRSLSCWLFLAGHRSNRHGCCSHSWPQVERLLMEIAVLPCVRVLSVDRAPKWCTLRRSDHNGMAPKDITISGSLQT